MLKEAAMVTHSSTTFNIEMSSQYIAISANDIRAILNYWFYSFIIFPPQILAVAVLLYTPLICNNALLVPILAAYAGVATRCSIVTVAYFRSVYPLLKKEKTVSCLQCQPMMIINYLHIA